MITGIQGFILQKVASRSQHGCCSQARAAAKSHLLIPILSVRPDTDGPHFWKVEGTGIGKRPRAVAASLATGGIKRLNCI